MKTEKKLFKTLFIVFIMAIGSSCNNYVKKEDHENKIEELTVSEQAKMDSLESSFISTLDEIDQNLDNLRDKYGFIVLGPKKNDDGVLVKDQILVNISGINNLLEENKNKITALEKSIVKLKNNKLGLAKSIEIAKIRIEEQTKMVEAMKQELLKKDYKIEELNQTIFSKDEAIAEITHIKDEKKEKLERKYFVYGTSKVLKEKQVFKERKGLDITKPKQLNPELNNEAFLSLNMYEKTEMAMVGRNPKILTTHPEGSYKLKSDGDNLTVLQINDPDQFWKTSNYLVVQVKQ